MFIYLCFTFFDCAGSSLLCGLSLVVESGACCLILARVHLIMLAALVAEPGMRASAGVVCGLGCCGPRALEHRLDSCDAWALLPQGRRNLPRPGIKPMSPILAGGLLTAGPPGKFYFLFIIFF